MKLLIDTCTWMKLDVMKESHIFSPEVLYEWTDVQIPHEVLEEIDNFRVISCVREKTTILPIGIERIYRDALDVGLDPADASLLSNGSTSPDTIIVSEDQGLIDFARLHKVMAMELVDFFQRMTELEYITKRNLYNQVKSLRELRNITKKRHKDIKTWLTTH